MTRWNVRRAVAAVLVVSLAEWTALPASFAAGAALLKGRVLDADGVSPLSDVVVTLFDAHGTSTFRSVPSDARGVFQASAPVGSYRLVASTPAGAFLAANAIELAEGANAPLALTLKSQAAAGDPASGAPPPAQGKKEPLAPWAKWTIIGGIAVASILAIDAVTSDESPASGF